MSISEIIEECWLLLLLSISLRFSYVMIDNAIITLVNQFNTTTIQQNNFEHKITFILLQQSRFFALPFFLIHRLFSTTTNETTSFIFSSD